VCIFGANVASAQPQPWTVSVYQGNGQVACVSCNTVLSIAGVNSVILTQFDPLYVKVTDANGNPVANTSVTWTITSGSQYLNSPANTTTTTDSSGLTHIAFLSSSSQISQNGAVQSTVTAVATASYSSVAAFTLTQTSLNALGATQVNPDWSQNPLGTAPPVGTTISGSAGSSGTAITVGVFGSGTSLYGGNAGITGPISGVSIRLVNLESSPNQPPTATVSCATGSGADPGSVLTDATGYATCNPIFSGNGRAQFLILMGGAVLTTATYSDGVPVPTAPPYASNSQASSASDPQPTYAGLYQWGPVNLQVTAATVGSIQFVSGNAQTATSGQALALPLVAVVTSTAGSALANQAVTWSVSPAGSVSLSNTSTATDANGRASTNATLSSSAFGAVSITLSVGGKSLVFTVTAVTPTQLSGLTKLSGDGQTALENAAFTSPLVVQVSVASGSVANQTVQFSATGPATLSTASAITDSNGRAQVNVQAGSTAGTVTVTATVGSYTATFTLTVAPPGPLLSASSFYNGADFQAGSISPCSIATIIASGVAPNVAGVVSSNSLVGYLNYTVASDTVSVAGAQAPIYNVANVSGQQQVTFQVPCSVAAGTNVPVTVTVGGGSNTVNVTVLPASPGVFQSQNSVNVSGFSSPLPLAVVVKRDGSLVSPQNPARQGETVIAYVTGLGPTSPSVGTNALPIFGVAASVTGKVVVGIQNAGVPITFAQLSEDLIGVYLVAFQIPSNAPQGNEVFSIGLAPVGSSQVYYSNPAAIYIQ
jgi:uncharacterized protein (TIGR03437 family)